MKGRKTIMNSILLSVMAEVSIPKIVIVTVQMLQNSSATPD